MEYCDNCDNWCYYIKENDPLCCVCKIKTGKQKFEGCCACGGKVLAYVKFLSLHMELTKFIPMIVV